MGTQRGNRDVSTEGKPCEDTMRSEDTMRRLPSTSQGERPLEKPAL